MKITRALPAVGVACALASGSVGPASAAPHKASVHISARADARTVLLGKPVAVRGAVSPAAAGPVVLEKLVNQDWVVFVRGRTTPAGAYSFTVGSAHRDGAWLLRVVRAATATTREADSATVRVDVVRTAYKVVMTLQQPTVHLGDPVHVSGTVTPAPPGNVALQWENATGWHTLATVPVGSNGGFDGDLPLTVGSWPVRALQVPDALIAGGESAAQTATVYPAPTYT